MIIKDQATATEAALNLDKPGSEPAPKPGEPAAPRSKSTSERLFPENISPDGFITNRPVKPYQDENKALPPVAATPASAPAPAIPQPPVPTAPSYLDLSKLPEGTMVRLKVDGVEMDVPAREALKSFQLERHLTVQGQKLAEERARLEAERAAFRQPAPAAPPAPGKQPPAPAPAAAEDPRIAMLEKQIADLSAAVAPQRFQAGLNRLAERAKTELGATDFLEYAPKIQAFVDSELARPEVRGDPNALAALDNANFWYSKYQEMKLKDVLSGAKPAAPVLTPASVIPAAPVLAPAGTTMVMDRNGNPTPIPVIESSSGVPSRESEQGNWQVRYQAAFETAKKTGRTEDWQEVFRLKREIPS